MGDDILSTFFLEYRESYYECYFNSYLHIFNEDTDKFTIKLLQKTTFVLSLFIEWILADLSVVHTQNKSFVLFDHKW